MAGSEPLGLIQDLVRAREVAIGLLHPGIAQKGLQDGRVERDQFLVEPARFDHLSLVLQIPGEIGEEDGIAPSRQFRHPAIVIFAGLRPVQLRQDHAHEIMRLGVGRRDPDRVAGMDLRIGQIAFAEQQQGQLLRRPDVVGHHHDEAPDQRLGGRERPQGAAKLIEHGERAALTGRTFEHLETEPFRLGERAPGLRGNGTVDQRQQVPVCLRRAQRREIERAAAGGLQTAAARAEGGPGGHCPRLCRFGLQT